ncbi:MAG: bacteriocin-like protein [Planctomycetota bacterium]|jgi:bacteriocin-like protein
MKNLKFNALDNNEMKSIKGGIIVEHIMSYESLSNEIETAEIGSQIIELNVGKKESLMDLESENENWITEQY